MLRKIQSLIRRMYGDEIMTVDKWAEKNSKLCSADEIIVAAIVKSIAMNYDDWKYTSKNNVPLPTSNWSYQIKTLTHSIRDVTVTVTWNEEKNYDIQSGFTVNGIEVDGTLGQQIRKAYLDIQHGRQRAKAAADKALAEQKRLEAAWNLAENLLGMKRNEFGALVPVNVVEE